ncbi:MAG: glycosyltransferase family 1 protein [Clostridium sp.]|nr:glycosyltransferase family 1 protein [Clostridium sp.]
MIIFNALQTTLSGGIGRYSYELTKSLYNIEKNMKIVVRKEDIEMFSFAKKDDLLIVNNISSGVKRNFYEQFRLPFIINKKYPNAILHYPDSMAPLLSKNKVVITVHDIAFKTLKNVFTWKTKLWKNLITNLSIKKADKIIAISNFTKNELLKVYGKEINKKIVVVLNGFNDFSKDVIDENDIKDKILDLKNEKYILTVSTISPRKNIDGLIRAYNETTVKDEYKLVVAGGNGWLSDDVFKTVDELHLSDKVIFTNKINDNELKFLYKNCEIFAYVSFYEGFGLPPLEAMSYSKPCLVSNRSSIPEVAGEAAILVRPENIKEISEGIEKIALEKNFGEKLTVLGAKNLERFSWEKCAIETKKLFDTF